MVRDSQRLPVLHLKTWGLTHSRTEKCRGSRRATRVFGESNRARSTSAGRGSRAAMFTPGGHVPRLADAGQVRWVCLHTSYQET